MNKASSNGLIACPFGIVGAPHRLDEVDASLRSPVFLLWFVALKWLLVAGVLGLIVAIQLHTPGFLTLGEWVTYGKLQPLFVDTLVYGWGFNAGFAIALWLMLRLAGIGLRSLWMVFLGMAFWNLGLLVGLIGIVIGDQVPALYLELPGYATPLMLAAYALIGVWGLIAYAQRESGKSYIAQWLVLLALFAFPWLFTAAQYMVVWKPAVGVVQGIAGAWYAAGLVHLWWLPLGLAAAYYLIPRVLGLPVRGYRLAQSGFFLYILIGGWACGRYLFGTPVAVWTSNVAAVGSILLLLPVAMLLIPALATAWQAFERVKESPSLRFVFTGLVFWGLYAVLAALMSIREVEAMVQFSLYGEALDVLAFFGGGTFVFFGVLYYLLPRLMEREWLSVTMMKAHFWGTLTGVLCVLIAALVAGWMQGVLLGDPDYAFTEALRRLQPWLQARSLGYLLWMVGFLAFLVNFFRMLFPFKAQREQQEPTLIVES